MAAKEDRKIVSVSTTEELKDRLKEFAESKRWSMSQAAEYLIEKGLDEELPENEPIPPKRKK